ncbi:CD82 antigen [Nasonia vitripennis]|uniref:Tetraspanin n=1 Tax=Nasonia vitripennis TaxID=7425 RepID=A0A7M7Q584_NASVI|nr:CD82 antigen [Nasonia vitripennis]
MMQGKTRLGLSKAFMCCSNIIFLMSGFVLMSLGALLLADSDRVLLSRLLGSSDIHPEQPLFYYVSLLVVGIGFVIAITGILGCWASCLYNCCITVSYVSVIVLLLIGKCSLCVLVVFWPHLLGVDVRAPRLLRALQRSYALPGREQFTAAIDLAQTSFSCCGINSSSNYGTSWWRLQELGRRELVVPLSCCFLNNSFDPDGFLNPEPRNLTLCQSLNPVEHQHARHSSGCLEMIESWVQDQALIMLAIGLGVVLIELCALLSTLLACSRLKKQKHRKKKQAQTSTFTSTQTLSPFNENDHDYGMGCGNMEHRLSMSTGSTFAGKS